jgi:hypothetical protein
MEGEFDDINTWSRDRKCHQGLFAGSHRYHSSGKFEFNSNNSDRLVNCTLGSNQLNSRLLPNANYMMKPKIAGP